MSSQPYVVRFLRGHLVRDVVTAVCFGGMILQTVQAANPAWWHSRQVIKPDSIADDYAAVNQGQFKNFVRAAIDEMNAELPGGAGTALDGLLAGWRANPAGGDAHAAVNQGQVKNVVKMIYTRLQEVGYATAYPWSHGERAAQDYALANIGQLKNLLSFDFTKDADRDGRADWLGGFADAQAFQTANWRTNLASGSVFDSSQHHSRDSSLGYAVRGTPAGLPANPEALENDSVTSIPGEFKVGQDGSASYTVRIETPKGIANVEPGITLEYNSNSGNGIAGVGWGIGGVTVINRGPATFEVDGFYDPADFDDNDRFYLDGERLLCVSGTYGTDGSEYRAQKEQFSKAVYHKPDEASGGWFEVWTKAGLRMEFGNCPTSCIQNLCPNGTAKTFTWAVSKVSDNLGNYWQVCYDDSGFSGPQPDGTNILPDYAPDHIDFTGMEGGTDAPPHRIQFVYEDRTFANDTRIDLTEGWLLGSKVRKSRRLKRIEVKTGGSGIRTYELKYERSSTTGRSLLKELHLNAGGPMDDAAKAAQPWRVVPPTVFDWDEGTAGWSDTVYDASRTAAEKTQEIEKLLLKRPHPRFTPSFTIPGAVGVVEHPSVNEYADAGVAVSSPGRFEDVDGDGFNDYLVSHYGTSYVSDGLYYQGVSSSPYFTSKIDPLPSRQTFREVLYNQGNGGWQPNAMTGMPWMSTPVGAAAQMLDLNSDGLLDVFSLDREVLNVDLFYGTMARLRVFGSAVQIEATPTELRSSSAFSDDWNTLGIWMGNGSRSGTAWTQTQVNADGGSGYGLPGMVPVLETSPGNLTHDIPQFYSVYGADYGWRMVDLNGDGHVDIVRGGQGQVASVAMGDGRGLCYSFKNRNPEFEGADGWFAHSSAMWAGETHVDRWSQRTSNIWKLPLPLVNEAGDKDPGRRLIDLNGDRLPDFIYQRARPAPAGGGAWPEREKYELAVYLNRGEKQFNDTSGGWEDGGAAWTLPGEALVFDNTLSSYGRGFMDLNGDGLPDFVAAWSWAEGEGAARVIHTEQKVYLNTGSGWTTDQTEWHLPLPLQVEEFSHLQNKKVAQTYARYLQDVNGDGVPEFIDAWRDEQASINGPGVSQPVVYEKKKGASGWEVSTTWLVPHALPSLSFLPRPRGFSQRIKDAQIAANSSVAEAYRGYLEDWTDSPLQLADLDGDGLVDLLHATASGTWLFHNTSRPEKLKTITNGLGVPITVNYDTLPRLGAEPGTAENPRRYVRGTKPAGVQSDVVPSAWVVTDYSTPDGIGGTVTSFYRYGGLRRSLERSLGFEWMEVRTNQSPVIQYTEYYQTPRNFVGLPKLAQSYYMNGTTKVVLSEATNDYATLETATALEGSLTPKPKSLFVYAAHSTTSKRDPDNKPLGSTDTTYAYDLWGNLETQTATSGDGAEVVNTNTYENPVTDGSNWILGRLKTASVTKRAPTAQRAEAPEVTKTSSFTYNSATGLLETETVHPGTAKWVTKTHYRDAFGNIVKTITTAAGETEKLVSETWYDATGRFAIAAKNALGHTVVTEYDHARSVATKTYAAFQSTPPTADAAHNATPPAVPNKETALHAKVHYDDWGTSKVSTGADGLKSVRFTKAFTSSALPQAVYYVYEQAEGGTPAVSYYDRHHRVLLTEKSGFDGRPILQKVTYNAKGKVTHQTAPYFHDAAAGDIKVTQTFYDDFDRQWKVISPDGTVSLATFDGLSATSTLKGFENGAAKDHAKTGVHDEHGRLRQSIDHLGNTVTFHYTADGLPRQAVTTYTDGSPSTTVSTGYDAVTREKKTVTDPNTGTGESFYDGFGRLVRTRDAMGVEHHFTYDVLGRQKTRTTPETFTSWTYDVVTAESNGLGKVHSVTHTTTNVTPVPTQYEETTYDALGRVVRTTLALGDQPAFNGQYVSKVSYDALGRVDVVTDPGGFATQNEYNAFGFKSGVREAHATQVRVLWRAFAYDAEGKLLQERHGNGVATDNVYHPTRGTLQASTSYRPGLEGGADRQLQKLELDINNLGNVEWRKSTTYSPSGTASVKTESFTFDALNRLKTSQVAGQAVQSFGYADNGNITSKTGTGTYSYDPVRRHAVESVEGSGGVSHVYAYDGNGRMTTEHARKAGENDRLIRSISYTSFHQPSLITHHASPKLATDRPLMGGNENFCQMQFYYGADLQRLMQVRMKGATVTRTLYLGAYEVREVFEGLPGPNNLLEREERSSFGNGAQVRLANVGNNFAAGRKLEFSLKDHLGSTSAVHDESGEVQKSRGQQPTDERHSYDAWGARRDNASWAPAGPMLGHSAPPAPGDPPAEPKVASSQPRGFTGHEMLDDVGLVHMNGRLYDAALGRFCSADPLIQEGENSQNYNRYTYVLNNPLSHTDPSGFSFWKKFWQIVVLIVIVIIVIVYVAYTGDWLGAMQFLKTAYTWWRSAGILTKIAIGAAMAAHTAAVNTAINGGSFSDVMKAAARGAVTGAIGAVVGGMLHGFGDYVGSYLSEGNSFWGTVAHVAAHGAAGGGMTEAMGGSFKDGFIASVVSTGLTAGIEKGTAGGGIGAQFWEALGPFGRSAVNGVVGGLASVATGGKFAEAAFSSAFWHLFNNEVAREVSRLENKVLADRRLANNRLQNGNMPISTDEMTFLMEDSYQDGLRENVSVDGITAEELGNIADNNYFRRLVPTRHHDRIPNTGYSGDSFSLSKSFSPRASNPHIMGLAKGNSRPYKSWEINYFAVGMWTRISHRNPSAHFWGYILFNPSKWNVGSRGAWFDAGYKYADARAGGWNPFPYSGNDS